MKNISKKLLKIILYIFIALIAIFLVLYILIPFIFGFIVTIPRKSDVGDTPAGFEDIVLTTEDGLNLKAWYKKPSNGAVIILLHGSSESRENLRPYAEILVEHGYGVLAFDQRGHGESDGNTNRFGWNGTKDVGAAVKFLKSKDDVKQIGALGNSMGGEAILGAASTYPEIKAIVSEGATYRSYEEFFVTDEFSEMSKKLSSYRITCFAVQLFSGNKPPVPTIFDSVKNSNAKFLFIAAGTKEKEKNYNKIYSDVAGDRGELWIVEGVDHVGAYNKNKDEYENKIIEFFDNNLVAEN